MRLSLLCLLFFLPVSVPLYAQPGCTDPLASNFDPGAMVNDGSCVYPPTSYTPVLRANLAPVLAENSGLVMAGGALWTHNDGGSEPEVYEIDSLTGAVLRTVTIGGASNVDWEDIAFDGANFYIGDFGNNANGNRTDLKIYKFPLAAIPTGVAVTVPDTAVEQINFSYEDQTNFDPAGPNNTAFDCEALVCKVDTLHLFTKDWIGNSTVHYTLPATAGTYQAMKRESFDVHGLVTAAGISDQGVILLLGYDLSAGTAFYWQLWDYTAGQFFSGNKRRIGLGSLFATGQLEGICFRNNRYGYLSNEGFSGVLPPRLYSFEIGPDQLNPAQDVIREDAGAACRQIPGLLPAGNLPDSFPTNSLLEIWTAEGREVWRGNPATGRMPVLTPGGYIFLLRDARGIPLCQKRVVVF